ncbi:MULTISPECIES: glycosyltransferase family 4 protein [Aphanothece]|uniref:glycosyltransferase family 4 protein n=1 Tax=Aphanothece TaxID=1121 RepID=UPI003984F082
MSIHAELVRRSVEAVAPDVQLRTVHLLRRQPRGAAERLAAVAAARWRSSQVKADVVHWLDGSHAYQAAGLPWSRTLITVHDLIPALQAEGHFPGVEPPGWAARQLVAASLRALRRAGAVCAVSQATAADLQRLGGRQVDAVVPLCLRLLPSPAVATAPLPRPYILHVGHSGFYKNRPAVIAVFAALAPSFPQLQLVLAGGAATDALRRQIDRLGLTERVHWHSAPSDAELVLLYRQASLLLFPSLYEGFGWPPLEAMALGCPVVCSNAGSLPEVVGSAALTCSPEDHEGLIHAAKRLLCNRSLRVHLIEQGRTNTARFSLDRMGHAYASLYGRLYREKVDKMHYG